MPPPREMAIVRMAPTKPSVVVGMQPSPVSILLAGQLPWGDRARTPGARKRVERPRKARIRANFSFMSFLNFIMREGDISV